ncbi:hypothetical protein [Salipiger sp. PrR003]|uniref:hypothetical protein n=1 Tax=Salipiger sp. PrR003 TaxID=2706776 RepID=UPI0013DC1A03|nr:hypothetical protein [Salipiger sp. PrR003]NDV50836.1 hypothetical protein [Salipiger sp. PrR003]
MNRQQLLDFVTRATIAGNVRSQMGDARRLLAMTFKEAMKGPKNFKKALTGMGELMAFADAEQASWQEPEQLIEPGASPINACDTRHWLQLAELAGVPFVPARTILSLTEDEFGMVSGKVDAPELYKSALRRRVSKALENDPDFDLQAAEDAEVTTTAADRQSKLEAIYDRLYAAMDDVPADHMVRTHLSGSSLLKAAAGTGQVEDASEFTGVGEAVKIGPGYLTVRNRRCIDTRDQRFIEMYARGQSGPAQDIHFLARPWITASRYLEADDPHRHGSVFAGKGTWPSEWRVFVEHGEIVGVSSYYAWTCDPEPENAYRALQAVEAAQRIVEKAKELQVHTRIMDLELLRHSGKNPKISEKWGRDDLSCSLDFLETEDGPMLLEGGPGHNPVCGANPCGFMGVGVDQGWCDTRGVALRCMPHVHLAEPSTWRDGDHTGCILTWEEARELAADYDPDAASAPKF